MVVKCPNCGQQVRGEPGMSGPCPKCGTRFTFPEIVSTQIEDVLPLKVEKKKAPKVLFIVPATIQIPRISIAYHSGEVNTLKC